MTYLFSVKLMKTIMITSPLCSLEGLQPLPREFNIQRGTK